MLREKIEQRMISLAHWLESGYHLKNPEEVENLIDSVSKFWSVLNEDDKEYIQAARYALENQKDWK
jgi:hypothetical protein